jgi:hypothetical protein
VPCTRTGTRGDSATTTTTCVATTIAAAATIAIAAAIAVAIAVCCGTPMEMDSTEGVTARGLLVHDRAGMIDHGE